MRYIDKIGYELEGGFKWGASEVLGDRLGHDPSISRLDNGLEYRSKPLELQAILKDLDNVEDWLEAVNSSCGFHIHISFKDPHYYFILGDKDFYKDYIEEVRKTFNEVNERLDKNDFCIDSSSYKNCLYLMHNQLRGATTRYTALNYAYHKFKTIEFRLFGATGALINDNDSISVERFKDYITFTANFIEDYLKNYKEVKQKVITKQEEEKVIQLNRSIF